MNLFPSIRPLPSILMIIPRTCMLSLNLTGIDMRRCIIHYLPVFPSQLSGSQTLICAAPDAEPAESALPAQSDYDDTHGYAEYYDPQQWAQQGQEEVRSRIPLIVLAQQNHVAEVSEQGTPRIVRPALSTITERTERTEATYRAFNTSRPLSSAPTSSYGEIIGSSHSSLSLYICSPFVRP